MRTAIQHRHFPRMCYKLPKKVQCVISLQVLKGLYLLYRRKMLPLGVVNIANKEPSLTGVTRPDTL